MDAHKHIGQEKLPKKLVNNQNLNKKFSSLYFYLPLFKR